MSKKDDALEQLRQRKIAMPDVAPPVHDGLWDLPGFAEAREYFHRRGLTGAWVAHPFRMGGLAPLAGHEFLGYLVRHLHQLVC